MTTRSPAALAVGALLAATAALTFGPVSASSAAGPPPSLDGQRAYWGINPPDASTPVEVAGTCDLDGVSTVSVALPSDVAYPSAQFLPDVGAFDPEPNPLAPQYPVPYVGPMTVQIDGTLGAHTLQPPSTDFTTGWVNEQVATRGLAAAPIAAVTGSATITTPDATVAIELSLPDQFEGFGSCYDDLTGYPIDGVTPSATSGFQFRLKVLRLDYTATITTADGTYTDVGTVALSARAEFYGSGSGGGVEMIFSSTAPIDTEGPTITCPAGTRAVLRQQGVVITADVSDSGSGVPATTVTAPVDTSTVGPRMITLTAVDNAGNETIIECPVLVTYRFRVVGRHGHGHGHRHGDHGGTTVVWRLSDAARRSAGGSTAVTSVSVTDRRGVTRPVTPRYLGHGLWIASLGSARALRGGELTISLDDTTARVVALG